MKDIYLVSFLQFRTRNQNVSQIIYIFEKEESALMFADSLESIQLAKVTRHCVWNSYQFALDHLYEENKKYEKIGLL